MVQMKIKIGALLMEAGVSYNKQCLHKAGYFRELLATNPDIDEGLCSLLRLCRETVVRLGKTESALVRSLERDSLLVERVQRLMTIPAVGPITALTWALEVGDVQRFSSIKKAISYCGLCGAEKSSGNTVQRTPLSKQRNKHLEPACIPGGLHPHAHADSSLLQLPIELLCFSLTVVQLPFSALTSFLIQKCNFLKARVIIHAHNEHVWLLPPEPWSSTTTTLLGSREPTLL
jgi:hypothetical protein